MRGIPTVLAEPCNSLLQYIARHDNIFIMLSAGRIAVDLLVETGVDFLLWTTYPEVS